MSSGRKMKTAAPRSFSLSGYVPPRSSGRAAHPPLHQRAGRQLRPPCRNAAGGLTTMHEAPNRITGVHAPENNGTAAATCVEHRHSRPHPRWSAKNVFRPCFAGPDGRRGCGARGQRALRPAEQGGIIINFAARRTPEKAFRGRCQRAAVIRPISHAVFTQETASLMRGGSPRAAKPATRAWKAAPPTGPATGARPCARCAAVWQLRLYGRAHSRSRP